MQLTNDCRNRKKLYIKLSDPSGVGGALVLNMIKISFAVIHNLLLDQPQRIAPLGAEDKKHWIKLDGCNFNRTEG